MRGLVAAALLLAFAHEGRAAEACAAATVHLVRHAEKAAAADPDPELSDAGQASAAALVTWFDGKAVDAIYTTHLRRTQQTGAPLAVARDLELRVLPAGDAARLLQRLRERHCGQHVLVVGHSNTVPEIAAALGADPFSIGEGEYGTVYSVQPGTAAVALERYAGAAPGTP